MGRSLFLSRGLAAFLSDQTNGSSHHARPCLMSGFGLFVFKSSNLMIDAIGAAGRRGQL